MQDFSDHEVVGFISAAAGKGIFATTGSRRGRREEGGCLAERWHV